MRLTKYPQSCLLIEEPDGGRVLVDPGRFVAEAYDLDDLGEVDAVCYTHRHFDHLDEGWAKSLLDDHVPVYANADVAAHLDAEDAVTVVADGDDFRAGGFEVTVHHLPHVPMVDGSAGPPNLGFVFAGGLLHPGDSVTVGGIAVDTLATPIAGPSISYRDAYAMLRQTGARTSIPVHYDLFLADPDLFADFCDVAEVVVLGHGESTTV